MFKILIEKLIKFIKLKFRLNNRKNYYLDKSDTPTEDYASINIGKDIENFEFTQVLDDLIYSNELDDINSSSDLYDYNYESDKTTFFKNYQEFKDGKIDIKSLSGFDLYRINRMLKEEIKLLGKDNKL